MHPATATSGHCTANHSCRVTTDLRLNCNINNEVTAGRLILWSFPVLRRGGTHMQNTRIQCPAKLFSTLTTTLELFLKRFEDLRSVLQQLKTHLWRYVPQYSMQVTYCVWVSPFHLDRKLCTAINQLLTSWNWHTNFLVWWRFWKASSEVADFPRGLTIIYIYIWCVCIYLI